MTFPLSRAREFLRLLAENFRRVRGQQVAASLAFTTLLSLVPLITVALALLSNFPMFAELAEALRGFLLSNLLPEKAGAVIAKYTLQFSQQADRLTAIGSLVLFATAIMLMLTIDRALNAIWNVSRPQRPLRRLLVYWAVLSLGPLVLGASVAAVGYVTQASLGMVSDPAWLRALTLRLVPLLLLAALLAFIYYAVPNRPVRLGDAAAGGFVAATAFTLLQRLFGLYLSHFPTYTLVYGAFATLPVFLLWLYLSWVVVLGGALMAAVLPEFRWGSRVAPRFPGRGCYAALLVLADLGEAQRTREIRSLRRLAVVSRQNESEAEQTMEQLQAIGWVALTEDGRWVLTCRPEDLSLRDVFARFAFAAGSLPAGSSPAETRLRERLLALHGEAASRLEVPLSVLFAEAPRPSAVQMG